MQGPCEDPCYCAKCVDPGAYDEWRDNNPREYGDWLRRNGFDTTCDICGGDKYPVDHLQTVIHCSVDADIALNDPLECSCW